MYQTHKKYQTDEKPERPNWRARCPLARAPDALKGGTLSDFLTSIVAKHQNIEGGTLWRIFSKKSLTMPKKTERGPFSLTRYCMLRGKTGKSFLVQFAWRNGSI